MTPIIVRESTILKQQMTWEENKTTERTTTAADLTKKLHILLYTLRQRHVHVSHPAVHHWIKDSRSTRYNFCTAAAASRRSRTHASIERLKKKHME